VVAMTGCEFCHASAASSARHCRAVIELRRLRDFTLALWKPRQQKSSPPQWQPATPTNTTTMSQKLLSIHLNRTQEIFVRNPSASNRWDRS
jgi:hypothetical protein